MASLTVLTVDDSSAVTLHIRKVLEAEGIEVVTAQNGAEALIVFAAHPKIDLIFVDMNMPVMSGIEMCTSLSATYPKLPPIVALTTESRRSLKEEGRKVGIVGWLLKPFVPSHLLTIVKQITEAYPV